MSESDETVCGNESEEENIENSPSILSNWRKDETVFSAQKDEKSLENNTRKECQEDLNKDVLNGDVPSPETEISPEFPLITRGLKRKEDFDETDNATPTDVQSKTNSMEIPDETRSSSSTEPENISDITDSQTTDDDKRLEKLKTVEELLNEMEMKSKRNGNTYNLGDLQNAKAQLADIQKILIESNHKNQEKRKTILSDAENTQQLSEEKKLMIVNLAKKQRILLEAFKKYKSLVQKLKTMKELNNTSISSTTTSKSSVALPNLRSEQPPNNSIQCSSQNQSTSISQGEESTPTSRQHPNCSVLSLNSHNLSTTSKASESIPRVVLPNTANPGLTRAIQQDSVKLIQNQHYNLSQISSQTQTNDWSRISTVSESRPSTISQNAPQSGHTHHSNVTFLSGLNSNTTVSIQPDMTQSLPQTHTTVSTATSQSSIAPTAYVNVASMIQRNQHSSLIRPTTMNQTIMPSNLSSNQLTTARTFSQSIATSSHLPVPSRSQPVLTGLSTSKPQTIGTSTPGFPRCRINQMTMRSSVTAIPELSLQTLVKKGILAPGKNVLTTTSEGKLYSASLSDKGTIISAGGEGFTSPRSWVKAILGSKRKVRNELAWKMVSYKNKPLLDQAYILTAKPTKATETSINLNLEANEDPTQTKISQRNTRREPINTTKALKALLSNCRIIGIAKEELLSSEQNFWDNVDMESVNDNIVQALDF